MKYKVSTHPEKNMKYLIYREIRISVLSRTQKDHSSQLLPFTERETEALTGKMLCPVSPSQLWACVGLKYTPDVLMDSLRLEMPMYLQASTF